MEKQKSKIDPINLDHMINKDRVLLFDLLNQINNSFLTMKDCMLTLNGYIGDDVVNVMLKINADIEKNKNKILQVQKRREELANELNLLAETEKSLNTGISLMNKASGLLDLYKEDLENFINNDDVKPKIS